MMMSGVPAVHPRSLETVQLAAQAFASAADTHTLPPLPPPPPPSSKPWLSWFFPFSSCFRPHPRRVNHAPPSPSPSHPLSLLPTVLPSSAAVSAAAAANSNPRLPFAVPPSSPATSSLLSESNSLTLSPAAGPVTFSPAAGPSSIFAIGPYAHDTRLVSPPVFSTEPSTAPFTPPPESLHLTTTTPPSPEVPFAHFLITSPNPTYTNYKHILSANNNAELFTAYQFPPGSPIGQLISPTSASSTRSSPYREGFFLPFADPPEVIAPPKLTPWHTRKDGSLLDGSISAAVPERGQQRRVSFELGKEDVDLCVNVKERIPDVEPERRRDQVSDGCQLSVSPKGSKEFVFENSEVNNMSGEPVRRSDTENQKNWPFLPIIESSVSR